MSLTDPMIKAAKPKDKLYVLTDERGLSLEITPQGSKRWRFRYQLNGKRNRLSLGVYPDVRLKEARIKRDEMRILIARGIDPAQQRIDEREQMLGTNSFEAVAREWFDKFAPQLDQGTRQNGYYPP